LDKGLVWPATWPLATPVGFAFLQNFNAVLRVYTLNREYLKQMKAWLLLISLLCLTAVTCSQKKDIRQSLYRLEEKVIGGDADALRELATYLDNKVSITESLGHHIYQTTARNIALRMLSENCLFTKDELQFDSLLTAKKFLSFLQSKHLVFDDITGMFLVTPVEKRSTTHILKELSANDLAGINTTLIQSPYPAWYYQNQLDGFMLTKDPQVLKWIASAWFKTRSRFHRYHSDEEEFLGLMKSLTHLELGVPDENGGITFLYESDYNDIAKLNYLVYWVNHYHDYQWDQEKKCFVNRKEQPIAKSKADILFSLLRSDDDSAAMKAFVELTEADTSEVRRLANDYGKNNLDRNYHLPTFPYQFLVQMSILTQHCRDNGIGYKPEGWLLDSLNKLNTFLEFPEQHRLENNIINRLSLDDITSVEYFGVIHEQNWNSVFSIGRILDVFYSKHWKELTGDKGRLSLYLKKSRLFNDLGIIGTCNDYLVKFENGTPGTLRIITDIANTSTDNVIRQQAWTVIKEYSKPVSYKAPVISNWSGSNFVYGVKDLEGKYKRILASAKENDDKRFDLLKVIGDISYAQIGEAIKLILKDTLFTEGRDRFEFLETDFGFDVNPYDSLEVKNFLQQYEQLTESGLYRAWLIRSGFDCFDQQGNFDLDKVYEIMKYGVIKPFVGGGGGKYDDNIYLVVKMLELKFNTTLGFPKKLCKSQTMNACYCDDRAIAWMHYLEEKKLVTPDKAEPVSFAKYE
jgi:hypothetical protein